MTRDDLLRLHENLCAEALNLMKAKNSDYAYGNDPFANFRMFGDEDALLGLVFRMGDKLRRLYKASQRGSFAVAGEHVEDTIRDIINYAILFQGLREELTNPSNRAKIAP